MAVPDLVVVLLCIIGAGAVVTVVAAFGKSMFSRGEEPENNYNQRSPEQDSYLRRVREMTQVQIWGVARTSRRDDRQMRSREISDIEVQSGMSYNAGHGGGSGYPYRQGGYPGGTQVRNSVQYEEYSYPTPRGASGMHEEPPSAYLNQAPMKGGPTETWSEVPR